MYAIVDIAGQQFKVQNQQRVYVHRLEAKEGDIIEFGNVLLIEKDGNVTVGNPTVDGARVAATVLAHPKADKVLVFKKKRRKGYAKLNGHRQNHTEILVQGILGKGETLKVEAPAAKAKKAAKPATKKAATKKTKETEE